MEQTYKKIEIVEAYSESSFGEATQNAVAKASQAGCIKKKKKKKNRGLVEKDKVKEFQVTVQSAFGLK